MATPTVSVCCITYNHERYLAQALDSVLMQQTDFAVEVVIGEDCSPDGTRRIALDYEQRFPGRIRVLQHATNQGIMRNLMATMAACTGQYIAFLEGDDYWTDPQKLQRQVQVMETDPACSLCIHDAEVFTEDGSAPSYLFSSKFGHILPAGAEATFSQTDLARLGWFMPSAAMLFRRAALPQPLPAWFAGVFSGDFTLQLLATQRGHVRYLPRVMSRYRLHAGGVMQTSHNTLAQNEKRIHEHECYKRELPAALHPHFNPYLEHLYFERSEKLGAAGNRRLQLYYYWKAVSITPARLRFHLKRLLGRATPKV